MRITETPVRSEDLALLRLLAQYGDGGATWRANEPLGELERAECRRLHAALVEVVDRLLGPLLDRVNAREMKTFTMHDSKHGLKVSHLMWAILSEERRSRLTPPEIAILVLSAHLHDMGMGISPEERQSRLSDNSDLWLKLDATGGYQRALGSLKTQIQTAALADNALAAAVDQVAEAEDALLCLDVRERHATAVRYAELINTFRRLHQTDGARVPSIDTAMRFGGDAFESRLIDVCVSHNEDAGCLLEAKPENRQEYRFPMTYPIGTTQADLRMTAAALRLADILDFDRERVPPVLYHYLLPRSATPAENISVREWQKHMSISNWDFTETRVTFRGRSTNPVAHHAVIEFCRVIEEEIKRTQAALGSSHWPFNIGGQVVADMHAEGFSYLPYKFQLQEEKIFQLLMGKGIYRQRLDAVRELLQNAVDTCQLKDALVRAYQPSVLPSTTGRIVVTYQDGGVNDGLAKLTIQDSGTGMDRWLIENYFLKVGESYYKSSDFLRTNAVLWKKAKGFAPVSEFGIGFVSVFMLSDRIEVETAMLHSPRKDATRRILDIDGLGRLISVTEFDNAGFAAIEGTRVTLHLKNEEGSDWVDLQGYLRRMCVDLPYSLTLLHMDTSGDSISREEILPRSLPLQLQEDLDRAAFRIAVGGGDNSIEGEIVLFGLSGMIAHQTNEVETHRFVVQADSHSRGYSNAPASVISRGGFSLGEIRSLPQYIGFRTASTGFLRLRAKGKAAPCLPQINLARTQLRDDADVVDDAVIQAWLEPLIADPQLVGNLGLGVMSVRAAPTFLRRAKWLESYSALDLYLTAKPFWALFLGENGNGLVSAWEAGEGRGLHIGVFSDYVHRALLELVLPSVATLMMGDQGSLYVAPPTRGWRDVLSAERGFPLRKIQWDHFARYLPPLAGLLYLDYPGTNWLSDTYKDQLSDFTGAELSTMKRCFGRLVAGMSRTYLPSLTVAEATILKRVASIVPDARIAGTSSQPFPLAQFLGG